MTLFDLIYNYNKIINKHKYKKDIFIHDVEKYTIDEKMDFILKILSSMDQTSFENIIIGAKYKIEIIITFLAVLELIKNNQILLIQNEPFTEIFIKINNEY